MSKQKALQCGLSGLAFTAMFLLCGIVSGNLTEFIPLIIIMTLCTLPFWGILHWKHSLDKVRHEQALVESNVEKPKEVPPMVSKGSNRLFVPESLERRD